MEKQKPTEQPTQVANPGKNQSQGFSASANEIQKPRGFTFRMGLIILALILVGGLFYALSYKPDLSSADFSALDKLVTQDKDYPTAETLALQLDKKYPNNVRIKLLKGEAEFNLKQYDNASITYGQILALDSKNQTALYYKNIIPQVQNNTASVLSPHSPATTNDLEARLGVKFDPSVLKFDSATLYSQTGNVLEAINATYESPQSVTEVSQYLSKLLPQPVIYVADGEAVEFHRAQNATSSAAFIFRVENREGKTAVSVTYSKSKQ